MSKEERKHYTATTETGAELVLTEKEYRNGVERSFKKKVGVNIKTDSVKRPLLKILFIADRPLTIDEIWRAARTSIAVVEEEAALFRTKQQLYNAIGRLLQENLIEIVKLDEPKRKVRHKYRILPLGQEWVKQSG